MITQGSVRSTFYTSCMQQSVEESASWAAAESGPITHHRIHHIMHPSCELVHDIHLCSFHDYFLPTTTWILSIIITSTPIKCLTMRIILYWDSPLPPPVQTSLFACWIADLFSRCDFQGIRTKFEALLTIRESHGMAFGKSDLFFVCALRWAKMTYSK